MNVFLVHKKLFILLALLTLGLFLFTLFLWINKSPEVESISPLAGSANIPLDQKIIVVFKSAPAPDSIITAFSPEASLDLSMTGNTLTLSPQKDFSLDTVYTLSLKNAKTQKVFFQSSFRTLPPQGSAKTIEESEKAVKNYYPLAPFDPPDKSGYYFIYTDRLKITVYLLSKDPSLKKNFEDWAKSKGVDLSAHQIQYLSPP